MVCDYARRPYRTGARFFRDDGILIPIRWYRAAPGAPTLPFPSRILSLDWLSRPWTKTGVGEEYLEPRTFAPHFPAIPPTGHFCGTPEDFLHGAVFDATAPPTKYLPISGLPECCAPGRKELVGKLGLKATDENDWGEVERPRILQATISYDGTRIALTFEEPTTFTGLAVIGINGFNTNGTLMAGSGTHVLTFDLDTPIPPGLNLTITCPANTFYDATYDSGGPHFSLPIEGFPLTYDPAPVVGWPIENGSLNTGLVSWPITFGLGTVVDQEFDSPGGTLEEIEISFNVDPGVVPTTITLGIYTAGGTLLWGEATFAGTFTYVGTDLNGFDQWKVVVAVSWLLDPGPLVLKVKDIEDAFGNPGYWYTTTDGIWPATLAGFFPIDNGFHFIMRGT